MHGVLVGAAALACPVGMGLMMWFMARGSRNNNSGGARGEPAAPHDIAALRDEHRRLGEQIERLTDAEPAVPGRADRVHS